MGVSVGEKVRSTFVLLQSKEWREKRGKRSWVDMVSCPVYSYREVRVRRVRVAKKSQEPVS